MNAPALSRQLPVPTRWRSLCFQFKAWALRLLRWGEDLFDPLAWHAPSEAMGDVAVLAESRSPLWPEHESAWSLVAGKVHNLRIAARAFDGVVVPAGATLSFWRQTGRATRRRGFVAGRELREGCLVPSVGGGLCQLSNALYETALRAGFEVVERHRHSQVIPGSLAEVDRDATVFWNYLDLRIRADRPWRIEVELDPGFLSVRMRAEARPMTHAVPLAPVPRNSQTSTEPGDCTGCDETECHRHVGALAADMKRAWVVDEPVPEFTAWRKQQWQQGDRLVGGHGTGGLRTKLAALASRVRRRLALWRGRPIPAVKLDGLRVQAERAARQLGPSDTRLVVSQGLLPYLWQTGELGGRQFDVLMNALPMHEIQRRLDEAAARHPESHTLRDFRADAALVRAEREALARAGRWISAHRQVLAMAGVRATPLDWNASAAVACPGPPAGRAAPLKVALAASSLARKGAYELREALHGLSVQLCLPSGAQETPTFWSGFEVQRMPSMQATIEAADLVVLPAWIEHQPRALLSAIARGTPVIATPACGLPPELPWTAVEPGDAQALRALISRHLVFDQPASSPDPDQ